MGTAKTLVEIRSLARGHTRTAVRVLVIMRSNDATPAARVSAANAILDWGWGKATQPLENSGEDALEPIHRIERVIGAGDDVADSLAELHQLTFLDTTPVPKFDGGHCWIAFSGTDPVAFASIIASTHVFNADYFWRVGLLAFRASASVAPDARHGSACASERVVLDHLRHDR